MAIVKPSKVELPEIEIESNISEISNEKLTIYGPSKVGKTRLAMTLSEFYDEEKLGKERLQLEDTLWLEADTQGTDTLKGLNVEVNTIKLWKTLALDKATVASIPKLVGKIQDKVKEIARMLAGEKISETSLKHAKEMVKSNGRRHL